MEMMAQRGWGSTDTPTTIGKVEHHRMSMALRPGAKVLLVTSYSGSAKVVRLS
jgi:hypothetical protein